MKKIWTRIGALLLCLCLTVPLVSCDFFGKKPAAEAPFTIASDTDSACRILYPASGGNTWKALAGVLANAIRKITGVTPGVLPDTESDADGDILLGDTSRALSGTATKALEGQDNAFSFTVAEGRLVIAATNLEAAKLAVSYFEMQCTGTLGGTVSEGTLTLPAGLAVTRAVAKGGAEPAELLQNASVMQPAAEESFSVAASKTGGRVLAATAVADKLYTVQTEDNGILMVSYGLSKGKLLARGESLAISGGATGMCYNPVTGLLTLLGTDGKRLYFVNPETLTLSGTASLSVAVDAIAYDPENLCYVVRKAADGSFFYLDNSCAKTGGSFTAVFDGDRLSTGAVALGGMEADSLNVYLLYKTEGDKAALVMQARDGTKRLLTPVSLRGSPVALTRSGRVFYAVTETETGSTLTRLTLPLTPDYDEPFELFNEKNTEAVDSSYISSKYLFDVYAIVKKDFARNNVLQGACTDGKYGYFFAEYQGGKNNYYNSETHDTVIVKVDMATLEVIKLSKPLPLGHSNDGCYNPYTGQLAIAYCGTNGATGENLYKKAVFVDPETLEITGEVTAAVTFYSIAYNPNTGQYIAARDGINFAVLDENFQLVRKVNTDYSSYDRDVIYDHIADGTLVTQGIDCDSRYVYYVLGAKLGGGRWKNYLVVFDYEGTHIFTKVVPDVPWEIENMFHIGKDIYVSYNGKSGKNGSVPYKPCHKITIE